MEILVFFIGSIRISPVTVTNNSIIENAEIDNYYTILKMGSYATFYNNLSGATLVSSQQYYVSPYYHYELIVKATSTTISCVGEGTNYPMVALKIAKQAPSGGSLGTVMRAAYHYSSWGIAMSLVDESHNSIAGGDVDYTGITLTGNDCSFRVARGSTTLVFNIVFTPFKNGELCNFSTGAKIQDCIANTPTTYTDISYQQLPTVTNWVFY